MCRQMINRRGEVVPCLVTGRMQYGNLHNIQAVRFTPLPRPSDRLTEHPPPALPLPLSRDAAPGPASSFVPIAQPPPLNAAPRPSFPPSLINLDTWPQLGPSPGPPPPSHELPTAVLGDSGNDADPLPLQGLQPPMPPSSAMAGPRASTTAVGGPSLATSALPPAAASGPPALSPQAGVGIDVALDEEDMQLLLEAIGWPVGGEGWEESGTDRVHDRAGVGKG